MINENNAAPAPRRGSGDNVKVQGGFEGQIVPVNRLPKLSLPFRSYWIADRQLVINSRILDKAARLAGPLLLNLLVLIDEEDGDAAALLFWELHNHAAGLEVNYEALEELVKCSAH